MLEWMKRSYLQRIRLVSDVFLFFFVHFYLNIHNFDFTPHTYRDFLPQNDALNSCFLVVAILGIQYTQLRRYEQSLQWRLNRQKWMPYSSQFKISCRNMNDHNNNKKTLVTFNNSFAKYFFQNQKQMTHFWHLCHGVQLPSN